MEKTYEAKKFIPGLGKQVKVVSDEIDFKPVEQADSTATTVPELVADFNELLANLREAGIVK